MREEFKNSTLVVIAHRLDTILDFDCVAVLDQGELVEFGNEAGGSWEADEIEGFLAPAGAIGPGLPVEDDAVERDIAV